MPFVGVAGLASVTEALVAVALLLGLVAIAYLIREFGQYIPFIGNWLAGRAVALIYNARNALNYFLQGLTWALQGVINCVTVCITWPLQKVLDLSNGIVWALYYLRNIMIPQWFNSAISYANTIAGLAYAYALSLYYQAIGYATAVLNAAYAYTTSAYNAAIGYAARVATLAYAYALALYMQSIQYATNIYTATMGAIGALSLWTQAEIADVRAWVSGLVGAAVTGLEADLALLDARLQALIEQYAAAALRDAITITDVTSASALATIWPTLVTDIDALLDAIPEELIDIRDWVATIPRIAPASLADALAGLGALAIPFLEYLRLCGIPMCKNLHGLGDLFGDLNSLATDAALLGLLIEAARDPHAAADTILTVVGPVAHGAATATKELIGV